MSDQRLRDLERLALAGDQAAMKELVAVARRAGALTVDYLAHLGVEAVRALPHDLYDALSSAFLVASSVPAARGNTGGFFGEHEEWTVCPRGHDLVNPPGVMPWASEMRIASSGADIDDVRIVLDAGEGVDEPDWLICGTCRAHWPFPQDVDVDWM